MTYLWYLATLFIVGSKASDQPCVIVPLSSKVSYKLNVAEEQFRNVSLKITDGSIEFDTVVNFVAEVFSINSTDCRSSIGVVGDLDATTASIIHTLADRANLNITLVSAVAPSTFLPTTHLDLPNLLHMNPLTHYVEALAAFLDHLNWTRIGLISDDTSYYEFAAELIQQKLLENPERRIVPFIRISHRVNKTKAVLTFRERKTDVIVVSTDSSTACLLLEEAQQASLTWPKYAWIFIHQVCGVKGMIALTNLCSTTLTKSKVCPKSGTNKLLNLKSFHNSILAVSAASNNLFFDGSFTGTAGHVKFREGKRLANICFIQTIEYDNLVEIAQYNTELQQLSVLSAFQSGDQPRGTTLLLSYADYNMTLRFALVHTIAALLFALVTVVLILYILFRKEPEVKATSTTVSLSMFLGCYMVTLFMPVLEIDPTVNFRCHLLIWMGLGGLPFPLIVATLFVKMLRIHLIFIDPASYKKTFFSDSFLFLYIVLLISPPLFILVVWSISDPFSAVMVRSPQENFIFVEGECQSAYTIYWFGCLLIYSCMLCLALACLALKSSKIRYKHFRDTKATNAFAYLSVFIIILTLIYWYFFRLQEFSGERLYILAGILHAGHGSIVILCQIFLFVPKVYPPLKRRLGKLKLCT